MRLVFGIVRRHRKDLACGGACRELSGKEVDRIILSRPAVEAGERLGFLRAICARSDP